MLTRPIFIFFLALINFNAKAQQIAKAVNCKLISSPGTKIVISGGITFAGTATFTDSSDLILLANTIGGQADWTDSTTSGVFINNNGTTIFKNTINTQQVFGKTSFHNLTIAGKGINVLQSNEVKNLLALDTGLIYFQTASDSIYVSSPAIAAITSTSNYYKSWVNGKLCRSANVISTAQYIFPIGKLKAGDSLYAPIKLSKFNTSVARYVAEYKPAAPPNRLIFNSGQMDHISDVEFWEINSDINAGVNDDAVVYLSWRGYSQVSATPIRRDSLLVTQFVNTPPLWWDVPGGFGGGTNVSGSDSLFGYVKSNNFIGSFISSERFFTIGTKSPHNDLPLSLLYFNATGEVNKVRLNWNVQHEEEVRLYEIERSVSRHPFIKIASINSLQKNAWLYTDFDHAPIIGWNYYRLKITGRLGKISYSSIRKIRFDQPLQRLAIFPNPATDILNIHLPSIYMGTTDLQLRTIDGKLLSSIKPVGSSIQLNVQQLAAGVYLIRATLMNGETAIYKFTKL